MIRVLHVIGAMDRAGAETMIMNYYRALNRDDIQFDFLVHTDAPADYDAEIEALGGRIFRIPRFVGVNYLQYKAACREFFAAHPEIDVVHGHIESSASIYLAEAKRAGIPTICHAHQSNGPLSAFELAFRLATLRNKRSADFYMAPSHQAGLDRFGTGVAEGKRFSVLKNAIDLSVYAPDEAARAQVREELGLEGKPVFGHVGRFTPAKNHPFLIEVFAQIKEHLPEAQLLLVGRGETEEATRALVKSKGLEDAVHFLGVREDIPAIMNAMDVFLFPSLWEGLGIVAVEAQACGLPCILSDVIPNEAVLLPQTKKLPVGCGASEENATKWALAAIEALEAPRPDAETCKEILRKGGYEINAATEALVNTYKNIARGSATPQSK